MKTSAPLLAPLADGGGALRPGARAFAGVTAFPCLLIASSMSLFVSGGWTRNVLNGRSASSFAAATLAAWEMLLAR